MIVQSKTKGGSCVRMQRLVPFDADSSLSEVQSKNHLSCTCQARLTTVNGTISCQVPGCPGTRWTRFRSSNKPGYPVLSPKFGGVPVRGGYPAGGTPTLQQVPRSYSYKEKGDAARIEPPPPSPSTCGLCARSSRTLFRPPARGDGNRMPSVLGESRASCPSPIGQYQTDGLTATAVRVYRYTSCQPDLVDNS